MGGPEQQPPARIVRAPGRFARRFGMGRQPAPHHPFGDRRGLLAGRRAGKVAQPAEAVDMIGKGRAKVEPSEIDRVDNLLAAAKQEIARAECLPRPCIAGNIVVGHGQQLERIFAAQLATVDRRLPAEQVEMIGDPLRQRQPLVIRDADEALALFYSIVRGHGIGRFPGGSGGDAPRVVHPPRSFRILSA